MTLPFFADQSVPDPADSMSPEMQARMLELQAEYAAARKAREQQENNVMSSGIFGGNRPRVPPPQPQPAYVPQPEPIQSPAPRRRDVDFLSAGNMSAYREIFGSRSGVIGGSGLYNAKYFRRDEV